MPGDSEMASQTRAPGRWDLKRKKVPYEQKKQSYGDENPDGLYRSAGHLGPGIQREDKPDRGGGFK